MKQNSMYKPKVIISLKRKKYSQKFIFFFLYMCSILLLLPFESIPLSNDSHKTFFAGLTSNDKADGLSWEIQQNRIKLS